MTNFIVNYTEMTNLDILKINFNFLGFKINYFNNEIFLEVQHVWVDLIV